MPESEPYTQHGSFKFGNVDMYERFGIMMLDSGMPTDLFLPSIRARKVNVPNRHGEYDFGAKYYDERQLTLNCITAQPLDKIDMRAYVREISYVLSKKSQIRLWNEPDKYYIGRIYDATELTQLRNLANEFTLTFTCEPFAYGLTKTESFVNRVYVPNYSGTAPTSTYIEIWNTGDTNITNIRIQQTDRKED